MLSSITIKKKNLRSALHEAKTDAKVTVAAVMFYQRHYCMFLGGLPYCSTAASLTTPGVHLHERP